MVTRRCGGCGKVLPAPQGRGRSRRYCTDACQQQAYRTRQKRTLPKSREREHKERVSDQKSENLSLLACGLDGEMFKQ
jgi:hypothetical protein